MSEVFVSLHISHAIAQLMIYMYAMRCWHEDGLRHYRAAQKCIKNARSYQLRTFRETRNYLLFKYELERGICQCVN